MLKQFLTLSLSSLFIFSYGQSNDESDIPNIKYTPKKFIVDEDSLRFKNSPNSDEGLTRTYSKASIAFFDTDDSKKHITSRQHTVLTCVEGYFIKGKENGSFYHYILDSLQPQKRYKIWEQTFRNGKRNGICKAFTLEGKLAAQYEYREDTLVNKTTLYAADGVSVLEEVIFGKTPGTYLKRNYNDMSGKLMREELYEKYMLNGTSRDFYETGAVEIEEFYIDGELNGTKRRYYPSGNRWTEVEYRNGKTWTALGSYLENGRPIFPGNLSNGTGVLHIHDKYGNISVSYMFMKGEPVR
jgi:antitoxin component YwqK of YwqJK toxin-antitoxin module